MNPDECDSVKYQIASPAYQPAVNAGTAEEAGKLRPTDELNTVPSEDQQTGPVHLTINLCFPFELFPKQKRRRAPLAKRRSVNRKHLQKDRVESGPAVEEKTEPKKSGEDSDQPPRDIPLLESKESMKGKRLSVTPELVELIVQLVSGKKIQEVLKTEEEVTSLRIFMVQVSHKRCEAAVIKEIQSMTLQNYREVVASNSGNLNRHQNNENVRTVLSVLYKFSGGRTARTRPHEFEEFRPQRYSEMSIIGKCTADPDFHERLLSDLGGEAIRKYSLRILRGQLVNYLQAWGEHYLKTRRWKARFISFPVDITMARDFFKAAVKSGKIL